MLLFNAVTIMKFSPFTVGEPTSWFRGYAISYSLPSSAILVVKIKSHIAGIIEQGICSMKTFLITSRRKSR